MRNAAAAVLLLIVLLLGLDSRFNFLRVNVDKLEYLVKVFLVGHIFADVGHRAVVKTMEIRSACHDKVVLFSKLGKLFLLLNGSGEVVCFDTVYLASFDKLFEKLNIVEHHGVSHNGDSL